MKTKLFFFACVAVGCAAVGICPAAAGADSPAARITVPGRVVNVVDGDTVDVEVSLVVRVRLLADDNRGCWAPESRTKNAAEKKLGLVAKQAMINMALDRDCLLDVPLKSPRLIDHLTLERMLAIVYVDGKSLGAVQIENKRASSQKGGQLGK